MVNFRKDQQKKKDEKEAGTEKFLKLNKMKEKNGEQVTC